ncbi:MAG: cysteine dioxygenase family protein [Nocardioidaceae bacterium]|nr:cysteine dioxygenase family protein [Nocardioidaceae bacterium]
MTQTSVQAPTARTSTASVLDRQDLPPIPETTLTAEQLRDWVRRLAARRDLWERYVRHDGENRYFVSLYRDSFIDVWLLCWNLSDDTGWHDHDTSSGAVVFPHGSVYESRPRLGGEPAQRTAKAGAVFAFGPDHIHRMAGAEDASVSIHAYSPPLWRMGQYSIDESGVMRRFSVSYADELRPIDR